MSSLQKFRYRPDIDGLRALAVLAVVLFHADLRCPGGYVGVDVFFIISGFLITSLIWKDLQNDCFSFANFWERRARRIAPALVVMTVIVLGAGWFLLLPNDFRDLGKAVASQAALSANIFYYLDSGYFSATADEKPLLHTWSLAVEEQFYLFTPFILWGLYHIKREGRKHLTLLVLCVLFVLSLALSIYELQPNPTATFYLLPTRAWELLMGSIVALWPASLVPRRKAWSEILSAAGLIGILAPIFLYTRDTPFPGLAALPPCLGAALLIWANTEHSSFIARGLACRPVVFVGLISYSLYLWHWPLFAYARYYSLTPLSLSSRLILVGLGVVCGVLSWRFVETPFRTRKLGTSRPRMYAYAGVSLVLLALIGLFCFQKQGFPARFPRQALVYADVMDDHEKNFERNIDIGSSVKLMTIGKRDTKLAPSLLVWGDSHAQAAVPAFDEYLKQKGLAGVAAVNSATPPLLNGFYPTKTAGLNEQSVAYNEAVFSYIQKQKISNVVLIGYWSYYQNHTKDNSRPLAASLVETVRRLDKAGARPWVMLDVPIQSVAVPKALVQSVLYGKDLSGLRTRALPVDELTKSDAGILDSIKANGGRILDPKSRFLSPDGKYYILEKDHQAIYQDHQHLSIVGAKLMLLPMLRDSLKLN